MKRLISAAMAMALLALAIPAHAFDPTAEITVISREDGSGTRGAFVELLGIERVNDAGQDEDMTSQEAVVTNSTSVVLIGVSRNAHAIGYGSMGALNGTVKALAIDGAAATPADVKAGAYPLARPFIIATGEGASEAARDFIAFILSAQGQQVVEGSGYIAVVDEAQAYSGSAAGKIVVSGSSSVTPVMEKLKEAYLTLNPDAQIELQQSDSTTGMQSVADGIADIGMASRALRESELAKGLTPTVIAMDGIAVIVHPDNPADGLPGETIRQIFTGEITTWSEAGVK